MTWWGWVLVGVAAWFLFLLAMTAWLKVATRDNGKENDEL